ncbi:chromosome partitioning protein ParA [Vibrio vulnificus]|nr:chromosome partitioning protein ParA [Vibrio vulnificus]EID0716730.1 chromosome partitioning protein ParA [Vibrio vulnificus]EID0740675.1 chromosome partitioning protein ParA [Vibrio vulnificus]EJL7817412.1 chromosome partitioning protein ParA [Vibrio vulnificus]EKG2482705.1 chromosome partitioning protein ParA [Vibrio vulnificus]
MASINGLPPAIIPGTQRTNKSSNKRKVAKNQQQQAVGQTSKVANAVAHSIQNVKESDIHKAQIQYDLPEGHARRAMQEYMDVMNQAKREELDQLLGVDIYI